MAKTQSNILAIIVWVIGLLGLTGFINPFGFYALIIPIIFWLLGNRFTKGHCKQYFNVLITAVVIYLIGWALNFLVQLFNLNIFNQFEYIALAYFAIMGILGLFSALDSKRYKPLLMIELFK